MWFLEELKSSITKVLLQVFTQLHHLKMGISMVEIYKIIILHFVGMRPNLVT